MNDVFESQLLYDQLDDLLGLSQAQLARLMLRAEQHPEAFEQFDLPRLAIGCRPSDRASVERLFPVLQHPQVRAHPGWGELVAEVINAVDSYSPEAARKFVGDLACGTVREVYDQVGLIEPLLPWLQPSAVAALLDATPNLPVRLLRQYVAEACSGREHECMERFVACFGLGSLPELLRLEDEDDEPFYFERLELADCIREGWASPNFVDLTLRWSRIDGDWQQVVPEPIDNPRQQAAPATIEDFRKQVVEALPGLSVRLHAASVPPARQGPSGTPAIAPERIPGTCDDHSEE